MNQHKSKHFRVYLNESAHSHLKEMVQIIKRDNPDVKITHPTLNTWVINWFFKNQFEKQKKQISVDHFDPVKNLQHLINGYKSNNSDKTMSPSELIKQLNTINSKIKKSTILESSKLPVVDPTTEETD